VPEQAFRLLRSLPLFARLPIATIETLATRCAAQSHAAGTAIVVQGEQGDSFYVIVDGTVTVHGEGVPTTCCSRGEFFGEIALLRDIPRVANVSATTMVQTLALGRADFLAAITSHAHSSYEAERVAADRLALRVSAVC
jgi:CRP-like cAMP-binding protein